MIFSTKAVIHRCILAGALCLTALPGLAQDSSGPVRLPSGGFGKPGFGTKQFIPSREFQQARDVGLFEDAIDIRSGWLHRVASATGRLDISTAMIDEQGEQVAYACTATALSDRLILTNAHCLKSGGARPVSILFLPNFRDPRRQQDIRPHRVEVTPVERGKGQDLDYAFLRLTDPLKGFTPPVLKLRDPGPGEPLIVVGHPEGLALHLSRSRCKSDREVPMDGNQVIHSCATRQGSSGSLIWSLEGEVVGLHAWGGGMLGGRQINRAVRITALAKDSATLRGLIPPAPKPVVQSGDCAKVQVPEGFYCERDAEGGLRILSELPGELEALRQKCEDQQAWACTNLGYAFDVGKGIAANASRAGIYYERACDAGRMLGCFNLGLLYGEGKGVPSNPERAAKLFKQACDGGEMRACGNLGIFYQSGKGVPTDPERAAKLYKQVCDGREMIGCFNLALLYRYGKGVEQDTDRANVLFQKACDGGHERSCGILQ